MRLNLADPDPGRRTATVHIWADHPDWDRTFFDAASGNGATQEAAVDAALLNVGLHTVHLLDHHATEPPDERFSTDWAGRSHDWSVWLGYITALGTGQSAVSMDGEPYWHLLKAAVRDRLGGQKVTYVKVTAAWLGPEITAEVRMNNVVSADLSALLREHVQNTWPAEVGVFHKQFFWIVQDAATYVPYPHSAAEIRAHVVRAGVLFDELRTRDGDQFEAGEWEGRLAQDIGDAWLASEIVSFVPEITARFGFPGLTVGDGAVIQAGDATYSLFLPQLASYAHLDEAVSETWCREVPERVIQAWAAYSALGNLVGKFREAGSEARDITVAPLQYGMVPGYVPR